MIAAIGFRGSSRSANFPSLPVGRRIQAFASRSLDIGFWLVEFEEEGEAPVEEPGLLGPVYAALVKGEPLEPPQLQPEVDPQLRHL
jgi:hypothetical protein